jgi:hypothetical protein
VSELVHAPLNLKPTEKPLHPVEPVEFTAQDAQLRRVLGSNQ